MLPNVFNEWMIFRPVDRNEDKVIKRHNMYLAQGYSQEYLDGIIITRDEAIHTLNMLSINNNTAFYEFYSKFTGIDSSEREDADLMYAIDEIYEDYKNPFWSDKYPNIGQKYLQLSSIEGEYSYFYDKETDALYGVDWSDMDDFMAGKLKPLFTSFYDFLEWYYSEEDKE